MIGCRNWRHCSNGAWALERLDVRQGTFRWMLLVFTLGSAFGATGSAADLEATEEAFLRGRYQEVINGAGRAIADRERAEEWRLLKMQAELVTGAYPEAMRTLERALRDSPYSVRVRLLGHEIYRLNNEPRLAELMLTSTEELARRTAWRYTDAASQVALARFFLVRGADPRQILEVILDRVKAQRPEYIDAYLASAELALEKNDYALAAEVLEAALQQQADHPEIHYRLAQAFMPSDRERAEAELKKALAFNPQHTGSLLLQANALIDSERYSEAEETLEQVFEINGEQPEAWAFRAVIAHLQGDLDQEKEHRNRALRWWSSNPKIDHMIGRELSRHYRFAEGAEYQRQALDFDPDYLPAKMQLSQDLLRLGDSEGWALVAEVNAKDQYNVVAHNLMTLRDHLAKFRTLESDGFLVRMEAREAELYGDRVLELLSRARETLCDKYNVELSGPVVVEIFPDQQDFAIRTFGLPGGDGFLGVCFGRVVTANSPASQAAHPTSWESVLWHEFCHVVTLEKTHNRMPRWLSEGISVYEELQEDDRWGQTMDPRYRQMILEEDALTPVSKLSDAFLSPPSGLHLQFAYYESSLVVEFLVEKYGHDTLLRILTDLGAGLSINESLQRYAGSLSALDEEFAAFARKRAEEYGPDIDWTSPDLDEGADLAATASYVDEHPENMSALQRYAMMLVAAQQWERAQGVLERIVELHPAEGRDTSLYQALAEVHRRLGDADQERAVLEQWAARASDAVPAYARLIELGTASEDWEQVLHAAESLLEVNPLTPLPHRALARAARQLDQPSDAIAAYQALLALEPVDLADAHFELAQLLHQRSDTSEAYRHVLQALEEAPRYRAAHKLLLELAATHSDSTESAEATATEEAHEAAKEAIP